MKIQFLNGGLANQAFQYIFARYYELSYPGEIMFMDDSYFALNTVHNGYELEKVFGIKPHMLSECFEEDVWQFMLAERQNGKSIPEILCENGMDLYMISEVGEGHNNFNPFTGKVFSIPCNESFQEILENAGNVYYHGYWINKNWFEQYKEIFLREFCFPKITDTQNQMWLERIKSTNSVSVHIRRGDYVELGWALNTESYCKWLNLFAEKYGKKWEVFVFSDDIDWCKKNKEALGMNQFEEVIFIEGNLHGQNYVD
ncbi:MAG: alpha-1,2-fucosyltransferase, partial [Lachnospiraceae bacterium]|nr:alpha-1,2-fucosyltransferase [Lachnospiraceae bacterium]